MDQCPRDRSARQLQWPYKGGRNASNGEDGEHGCAERRSTGAETRCFESSCIMLKRDRRSRCTAEGLTRAPQLRSQPGE